ncbi:MAG: GAF and ANTAR domain-containing protein [Nocardioides sp.]
MDNPAQLAAHFALVSRELLAPAEGELTFQRIAEQAVEVIPACDFVGITLRRRRGRADSVAVTDEAARSCDDWQYELDEGPCLSAIAEDETYLIDDVATDPRWPRWGPRAADAGAGSILSVRMADDREALGALNMYARKPHAWDTDSIDLALVFASHAATAISNSQLVSGLQTALQSRHLIGVAQGILMSHYDMGLETAFEVLRRYSSHTNVKLRDVAQRVVELRTLPDDYSQITRAETAAVLTSTDD